MTDGQIKLQRLPPTSCLRLRLEFPLRVSKSKPCTNISLSHKTCQGDQHSSLFRRGVNGKAFLQQRHLVGHEEEEKGSGSECGHGGVTLLVAIAAPETPGLGVFEKFGEVWLRLAPTYRIKLALHFICNSYQLAISPNQGILKGEVSLYHWPPVWLVWI